MRPELYWISGSAPSWRVMLAFTLKGVPFTSKRLDHGAGENKTASYLSLNPKGQVPTVVFGGTVIRESIAILAWMDRAFPECPIFGDTADHSAAIWQDIMIMEGDLRAPVAATAQGLLRGRVIEPATVEQLSRLMDGYEERLTELTFLGGETAMAADIWLYPALHWIARGVTLSDRPPPKIASLVQDRPAIEGWMIRMRELPGVDQTYPPHWRD
ncbi:glutathione S-transferase family protein [Yoonia sp. BS5-3]|uniref:Glutathione S-transferase family protein n=1 Tax=Yoonia phaeophyticola TaxID=3137369 RepID=A0ABZ2V5Q3_9RHOB